jgi:hypothetical protein
MNTSVAAPPPAPTPVDPGKSAYDYTKAMADPALQQLLLDNEQKYRPQYTNLNLQQANQYLTGAGVKGQEGYVPGLLDQAGTASEAYSKIAATANTSQRQADIADVEALGKQASDAFKTANPELYAQLANAQKLGANSNNFGGLRLAVNTAQNQDLLGGYSNAVTGAQDSFGGYGKAVSGAQDYSSGLQNAIANTGDYSVAMQNALANQQRFGNIQFTPAQAAAAANVNNVQGMNAAQVQGVQGQDIGAGQLGGQMYNQALNAGPSQLSQGLQQQGLDALSQGSNLSPAEIRQLQQSTREAYASRGTEMGSAAVTAEALAQSQAGRQRQMENVNLASGINQQLTAEQQANRAYQQSVQQQEIGRQQSNVGVGLQAQLANQGVSAQQSLANQQNYMQAQLANQGVSSQQSLANQQAYNQFALANQQAGLSTQDLNRAFAAQQQQQNYGNIANLSQFQAQQNQQNIGNIANLGQFQAQQQQQNISNYANLSQLQAQQQQQNIANYGNLAQAKSAEQQQQIANQGLLGQASQGETAADRAYALQLAGQYANTSFDPMMAILGRQSTAPQMGAQQQNSASSMMAQFKGSQLFDPNAGINLALQNSSNLGNYNASTYGAKTGAQGAITGGMLQGIGSLLGCWVAREVYGTKDNRWMLFRMWLTDNAPIWFRNLYMKHGEQFALWIANKPFIKSLIRKFMDGRIKAKFGPTFNTA